MPTVPFSFRIDADTKSRLDEQAAREDRSASSLVQRAIDAYLDEKAYKRECIMEAVEDAKKGDFISEETMDAWVESWGTQNELPAPQPDMLPMKPAA